MPTQIATEIASIVAGRALTDAPGGRLDSTNPARTDDIVTTALLGDAGTFVDACRAARVWKPADYAPATAEALAQLFLHAGLPEGVLNLVLCDGPTTSEGLGRALDEGVVDKVGFTGSSEVGRRIGELCGRHLQHPCLELGGKNPMVVMEDADLDLAVEGALFSGFGTAGQRCTSLGTVIVADRVHDEFLARFTRAVEGAA